MRKKIFTAIAAATMSIMLAVGVWAAPSIIGGIDMPQVSSSEGTVALTSVSPGTYPESLQRTVEQLNAASPDATVKDAFGDALPVVNLYNADGVLQENMDLSLFKFLSPVMDLKIEGATPTEENPVKVTFVANNLTDNLEVFVLHYCDKHGWELLTTEKISSNQVAANFHSASPVALVYKEKKASDATPTPTTTPSPSGGQSGKKSPQTGERSAVPMVILMLGCVCVGGVVLKRTKKY